MELLDVVYSDLCDEHGETRVDEYLYDFGKPYEQTQRARREQEAADRFFGASAGDDVAAL